MQNQFKIKVIRLPTYYKAEEKGRQIVPFYNENLFFKLKQSSDNSQDAPKKFHFVDFTRERALVERVAKNLTSVL